MYTCPVTQSLPLRSRLIPAGFRCAPLSRFRGGPLAGVALIMRIDQVRTEGLLGGAPVINIAVALSALGQGLVPMQRANRFSSDGLFRALFRAQLRHCLPSFATGESR